MNATDVMVGPSAPSVSQGNKPLTSAELKKRLTLHSPALVKEVFEITRKQVEEEKGRQTRLDAKATSLLGSVGLSLTVLFTYGGMLINHAAGRGYSKASAFFFCLSVVAGVVAGGIAMLALKVREEYRVVGEDAVFNDAVLKIADGAETEAAGTAIYQRFMAVQYWEIATAQQRVHRKKAEWIGHGQTLFMVFLGTLFVHAVLVMVGII